MYFFYEKVAMFNFENILSVFNLAKMFKNTVKSKPIKRYKNPNNPLLKKASKVVLYVK